MDELLVGGALATISTCAAISSRPWCSIGSSQEACRTAAFRALASDGVSRMPLTSTSPVSLAAADAGWRMRSVRPVTTGSHRQSPACSFETA